MRTLREIWRLARMRAKGEMEKRKKLKANDINLELVGTFKCTPPPDWVLWKYDEQKQSYFKRQKEIQFKKDAEATMGVIKAINKMEVKE